jgi:hypothetical protein
MEPDFSGWATKAGLRCSDGRTIMPDAFKHQDKMQVPLVWQHGHKDPENVLGHVVLENRNDGVYAYGYFNDSPKAQHAKGAVAHKDINQLSIWANDLVERSKRVLHGAIREVSLVLSGANPGAVIDNITIRHSDGDEDTLDDEAIIYTGLEFEHSNVEPDDDEETVKDVYDSMTDKQKEMLHSMVGEALEEAGASVTHAAGDAGGDGGETIQDVYDSMSDKQKQVLHFMVGQALEEAGSSGSVQQDNIGENDDDDKKGTGSMKHNIFEEREDNKKEAYVLSHSDIEGIVADAKKSGSLKAAVENFAEQHLEHGIQDIETLFPEAKNVSNTPELFARRTEWVADLMGGIKKSPFARVRTMSGDLTVQEARAKGYIKGTLKKEEFFRVSSRTTTPTTIYKKQKLDRDDMVDITDFDVVAWLKGEMRLMLDEELARVNEDNIRPIATDHELFTTQVNVNIDDAGSDLGEVVDSIILNRQYLRGSGLPTMYTTETYIGRFMTMRDGVGRRLYKTIDELATELRVSKIVPVEVLEEYPTIVAILVNPIDYQVGANQGGEVNLFDDFDIDYNQYKYLIETRCSGALTKLKSALVVNRVPGADVLVTPTPPTFDGTAVTIVNTPNVVYRNADTDAVMTAAGSPYPVAPDTTLNVHAEPAAGYYLASSEDDDWSFTNTP